MSTDVGLFRFSITLARPAQVGTLVGHFYSPRSQAVDLHPDQHMSSCFLKGGGAATHCLKSPS